MTTPTQEIKDLLDALATLSEKFDTYQVEEVQEAAARRIEKIEGEVFDKMASLAVEEGKQVLLVIGNKKKLGARIRLDEEDKIKSTQILPLDSPV